MDGSPSRFLSARSVFCMYHGGPTSLLTNWRCIPALRAQALRKTVGNDPVAAMDWLCLNVPEAELSKAFAPRQHTADTGRGGGGSGSGDGKSAPAVKRMPFGRPLIKPAAALQECT